MFEALLVRFPPPVDRDLDWVIGDLEELWLCKAPPPQWSVEVAARLCPVFRHITGRPVR